MIIRGDKFWLFRFCVGDKFYLCENKILCQYDFEERMTIYQAAYNNRNLTELNKNIEQLENFEQVLILNFRIKILKFSTSKKF